jgi:WD40 repeat protein
LGRSYADRARDAIADGSWPELVFENLERDKLWEIVYEQLRAADPALGRMMARSRGRDPLSTLISAQAPLPDLAPWVCARMVTMSSGWSKNVYIVDAYDLGGPIVEHLEGARNYEDIAPMLAGSRYVEDRDAACAAYPRRRPPIGERSGALVGELDFGILLARRDDPRADPILTRALEHYALAPARPEDVLEGLLPALVSRRGSPERTSWIALLAELEFAGHDVYATLAELIEPGDEVPERVLQRRALALDERPHAHVARMSVDAVLAAAGGSPGFEAARWVRDHLRPRRYGWPKAEFMPTLDLLRAHVSLALGEDLEWVASLATAADPWQQALADQARARLGMPPLRRLYVDKIEAKYLLETKGRDHLLDLLERPELVGPERVAEVLVYDIRPEGIEAPEFERVFSWALPAVEACAEFELADTSQLPGAARWAGYFLGGVPADELEARAGHSESLIVQGKLLGREVTYPTPPPVDLPRAASIERPGGGPFQAGHKVLSLAASPDGTRLLATGESFSAVWDADTGERMHDLGHAVGWAYDSAWDPTGNLIAVCSHGGHVQLFDATTGALHASLEGHSGVPAGVRTLAFGPDGDVLATGADDGKLFLWDVAKQEQRWSHDARCGFSDIVFLDDERILACADNDGKKKTLIFADVATGEVVTRRDRQVTWALAVHADGRVALGGSDGIRLGTVEKTKVVVEQTWEAAGVVRLEWRGDVLWGSTVEGEVVRLDVSAHDPTLEVMAQGLGQVWGLALIGDTVFVGGTSRRVDRLVSGVLLDPPPAHTDRITGLVELGGGEVVSLDWRGTMLAWSPETGAVRRITTIPHTTESMALSEAGHLVVGTRKALLVLDPVTGDVISTLEGRHDEVAVHRDQVWFTDGGGVSRATLPNLERVGGRIELSGRGVTGLAVDSEGCLLAGTDNGYLHMVEGDEVLWSTRAFGRDYYERGTSHSTVCSVVTTPSGYHVVSGSTDDTVRIHKLPEGEPVGRIQCDFGLFNRLRLSPDGQRLAIPNAGAVDVWDMTSLTHTARLDQDLGAPSCALFLRDGRLVVGNKAGELFVVTLEQGAS